jgi:hypothetical protein
MRLSFYLGITCIHSASLIKELKFIAHQMIIIVVVYTLDTSIGGLFCPPNDITVGQAADIVFKYLDSHPEIRNIQANFLVVKAMTDAYPCKTK